MTLITGIIADSAGVPANGLIEFAQVSRIDTGAALVTGSVAIAQVVDGVILAADGSAFDMPANPEGTSVRVVERLGGRTYEWFTQIPAVGPVEYRSLVAVEPVGTPQYAPPPWLGGVFQARDDTLTASDVAVSSAADAVSAKTAAEAAAAAAEAVPTTNDTIMAGILGSGASASRTVTDGTYVQLQHRPVNLAERLPPGHASSDPVDSILATAINDAPLVEIPDGVALTFTDPAGITIPAGKRVRAGIGATATINHAGAGFRVSGALSGLDITYTGGSGLADVGVHVLPSSSRAIVSGVRVTGGAACFAIGGNETTGGGNAVDALLEGCVGSTTRPSSYVYRVDESVAVTLSNCIGLGSTLDSIKLRRRASRFRVIGGRYTGATGGDGLDGFAGADEAFIGGGVIFHDNVQNGFVFKTDDIPPLTPAEQAAQFGVPRRIIIDGVITSSNGGNGATLHRSDDTDSDVAGGALIPWLRQVLVSNLISSNNTSSGLFLNVHGGHLSGVHAVGNHRNGINVHANARDITMTGVQAWANGSESVGNYDNFYLAGQRLFLAQCMAFGVDPDAVTEADMAAATKISRYGFRIPTGALVRMVQCQAAYNLTAPVSDSDGNATFVDSLMRDASGTQVANYSGHLLRNSEVVGFRDAANTIGGMRLITPGANPVMMIGDNSATGLNQLILAAKGGTGSILASTHLLPQAGATYDLGSQSVRWRDIGASRYLKVGTVWLRDNAGAFEKSTDGGSTWSLV